MDDRQRLTQKIANVFPDWRREEVLRNDLPTLGVNIASTPAGQEWIHGK